VPVSTGNLPFRLPGQAWPFAARRRMLRVVADHEFEHERGQTQVPPEQARPEQQLSPVERLASSVGNQAFGALARQGAGILPDGRAHPDVEATIARTRGGGSGLDSGVAERMGSALGDDLSDVRVHTDDTADALASSVSARAFTTGSDVYFAKGEYDPASGSGNELLAHELSHVVQQRGAPTSGPLQVSMPGDALETEAEQASKGVSG
jgi:hypothetical protein